MEWLTDILNGFKETFIVSGQALNDFLNLLNEKTIELENLRVDIELGQVQGLDILSFISAFRYVVGDTIFLVFYSLIMIGLLYTIYHLVVLITNKLPLKSILGGIKGLFFK